MMLQQTQANRVVARYEAFLGAFPSMSLLAAAPLSEVLKVWSGLGYNRRALYLKEAAAALQGVPEPWTYDDLAAQKGIGPNTAKAVVVYSYNQPQVFIETNIRTVLIHHFFKAAENVRDQAIETVLAQLLDTNDPRKFYWALMDYGTHLKKTAGNTSRRSSAYVKQSRFEGSRRQLRGQIIKLLSRGPLTQSAIAREITDTRLTDVLRDLEKEGFVKQQEKSYRLPG